MALSFVYLTFVSLLKLLIRCGRTVDVKDIELLVLRHQLGVLRRDVKRPKLRASDRALLAAMGGLLAPARRHGLLVTPYTLLRWHRELVPAQVDLSPSEARAPADRATETRELVLGLGAGEPAVGLPADRRGAQQARSDRLAEHGSPRACQCGPWSVAEARRELPGVSSWRAGARASWRVTSSAVETGAAAPLLRPVLHRARRPVVCTSRARRPTRTASGSPSRRATSASAARLDGCRIPRARPRCEVRRRLR